MKTAILFVLMMLVLIGPHEFGHFIVAKLCNVKVNEFSIGMGPLIWKKKKGETQYSLRLIPIGGYNAMEGEDENSDDPRAFNKQGPLQRLAILIAGVTMNVIIALLICIIIVQASGVPVNKIASVDELKPAAVAGLQSGDKIIEVDGVKTNSWAEVTKQISKYDNKNNDDIEITYEREGKTITTSMVPYYDKTRKGYIIGITADVSHNPLLCIREGAITTWELNKTIIQAFKMIFTGKIGREDVAGPVGLVKVVNQTKDYGIESFLLLLALVSLNLAIMNLLPIPGLDGGKILFVLLKLISRGKITDDMEFKATMCGMILLLGLFVVLTVNDIGNLIGF